MASNPQQAAVIDAVLGERASQDAKWGPVPRGLSDERWLAVLVEEVGETAEEVLSRNAGLLVSELIQVAAVAVAWIEELTHDRPQSRSPEVRR